MQVKITIRGRGTPSEATTTLRPCRPLRPTLIGGWLRLLERTRSFDEYTIAMLTALNIASELHQPEGQVAQRLDEIDRDAASVAAMIEAALPGGRRGVSPGRYRALNTLLFIGTTILVVTAAVLEPDPSGIWYTRPAGFRDVRILLNTQAYPAQRVGGRPASHWSPRGR